MTLPSSGSISFAQIATELGRAGTSVSLNQSDVAALAGKTTSSAITVPNDFWGKSSVTWNFSEGETILAGPSYTLTCSVNATWTLTRTSGLGNPTSGTYGPSTSQNFFTSGMSRWNVTSSVSGGPSRSCTLELENV